MTGKEFETALSDLGMYQAAFARLCGVHPVTVSRWVTDTKPMPQYAISLVKIMQTGAAAFHRARQLAHKPYIRTK